jgi:hypothetical protein
MASGVGLVSMDAASSGRRQNAKRAWTDRMSTEAR